MLARFHYEDGFPNVIGGVNQRLLFYRFVSRIRCSGLRGSQGAMEHRVVALTNNVIGNIILIHQREELRGIPRRCDVNASEWGGNSRPWRGIRRSILHRLHGCGLQGGKATEVSSRGAADRAQKTRIDLIADGYQ